MLLTRHIDYLTLITHITYIHARIFHVHRLMVLASAIIVETETPPHLWVTLERSKVTIPITSDPLKHFLHTRTGPLIFSSFCYK